MPTTSLTPTPTPRQGTKYPRSLGWIGYSPTTGRETTVLKPASDNRKLGSGRNSWTKGPFKGLPLYSLTLEEHATCQADCPVWDTCYGRNMPWAHRWDISLDNGRTLMNRLSDEISILNTKYPGGFSLRLHVLGDFFSVRYVAFWRRALRRYPLMKIFGYTHRTGDIGRAIDQVFTEFYGRFVILQSDPVQETIRPIAVVEGIHPHADRLPLCREQAGTSRSCLDCGLCANPSFSGIRFSQH